MNQYPDPYRGSCLEEGFYRHCVNTCLLSRCLSLLNPLTGPFVAEQVAIEVGGDRGTNSTDLDGNEYGMGNSWDLGTCEDLCYDDFFDFMFERCCSSDVSIVKSPDPPCCEKE